MLPPEHGDGRAVGNGEQNWTTVKGKRGKEVRYREEEEELKRGLRKSN